MQPVSKSTISRFQFYLIWFWTGSFETSAPNHSEMTMTKAQRHPIYTSQNIKDIKYP